MDDQTLRKARRMLNNGASYSETSRATGLCHETLSKYFPGRGWKPDQSIRLAMQKRWPDLPEQWERFKELQAAGWSAHAIAAEVGVTVRTVVRWRKRAGVSGNPGVPLTVEELTFARTLLEDGASYQEVARTLGRDGNTIRRRLPGYAWTRQESLDYARMIRHHREGVA